MRIIYLESNLFEKSTTKPDKQAIKILVNSGLFSEEEATQIIDELFTKKKIHAFTHSGSWMDKYIKGVARMIIEEANGDKNKAFQFINDSDIISVFDEYLKYVKEVRDKQDNPTEFDKDFVEKFSFNDVENFIKNHQNELEKQSKDELSKMKFTGNSNYELVPIDSYEEFHSKFGGRLTGDGSSDKYAGGGGTAWCHANSESTYNNYVKNGRCKFYVLMNKDFKDIPFNSKTNIELKGKDDYGNSLIAILVNNKNNKLRYATLRCNHVGVPSNADNQYKTYAELSKIAGFNVEDKINQLNPLGSKKELHKDADELSRRKALADFLHVDLGSVIVDEAPNFFKVFDDKDDDNFLGYGYVFTEPEAYDYVKNKIKTSISNYGLAFSDIDIEFDIPDAVLFEIVNQEYFKGECEWYYGNEAENYLNLDSSYNYANELIDECLNLGIISEDSIDEDGNYTGFESDLADEYVEFNVKEIGRQYEGNYFSWFINDSYEVYNIGEYIAERFLQDGDEFINLNKLVDYLIDDLGYELILNVDLYDGFIIKFMPLKSNR